VAVSPRLTGASDQKCKDVQFIIFAVALLLAFVLALFG
jgi:hypothetical protein